MQFDVSTAKRQWPVSISFGWVMNFLLLLCNALCMHVSAAGSSELNVINGIDISTR